jgi:predicted NBD/HSP70 family sugar kinase
VTAAPGSGSLRRRNRLRVVDVLRESGSASRVDVQTATGLSRTTVSTLVAELQAEGLVVERRDVDLPEAAGSVGRPPVALSLNPQAGWILGVDLAHDGVRAAIADLAGDVVQEARRTMDVDHAADDALDTAAALTADLVAAAGADRERVLGVGVAVSGPILRASGELGSDSILPGWGGVALRAELEDRLGLPVVVGNDANLGALAEVQRGAARGARDVIYVMLSAGIGAGLVIEGRLVQGRRGLAGELGHVVLEPDGRICRCGNRGCLETVAAGPALLDALRHLHGDGLTLADAVDLCRRGDEGARRLVADAGRAAGRAVGAVANAVNPELVVVGGDLSALGDLVVDGVREGLERSTIPPVRADARVVAGSLGQRSELLGAIGLVLAEADAAQLVGLAR